MARSTSAARRNDDRGVAAVPMPRGDSEPPLPAPTTLAGFSFLTMSFDIRWIRQAIYSREWTPEEFAADSDPPLSVETVYNAINGRRLRPVTVQRVYRTLRKRQPQPVTE